MIGLYSLGFVATGRSHEDFVVRVTSAVTLRPQRILTNVHDRQVAWLTSLLIEGKEQFVGDASIDVYECSLDLAQHLNREFLRDHGLQDKSDEQVDRWLDDREMSMPGDAVGRMALPTIAENSEVVVAGKFGIVRDRCTLAFSILGMARSS